MSVQTRARPQPLEALFLRFREAGDPGSLGALFDATAPGLFRLALSLAPDAAAAEDAVQETFVSAMKYADRWDAGRPLLPWLTGILRRRVEDARRRTTRIPDPWRVPPRIATEAPGEAAGRREEVAEVRRALEALPEPYRTVGMLRWRHGLSPAEIAELRGEPPGTVRSTLSRALERLRRDLRALPALLLLRGGRATRGLDAVRREVLRGASLRVGIGMAGAAGMAAWIGGVLVAKKAAAVALVLVLGLFTMLALRWSGGGDGRTPSIATGGSALAPSAPSPAPESVAAPPSPAPVELAGEPTGPPISGRVMDREGRPIPGTRVFSIPDDLGAGVVDLGQAGKAGERTRVAAVDAAGGFVVPLDRATVVCTVLADAPGFARAERNGLRPGAGGVVLVLDRSATLSGRVLAEEGGPVPGALVRIYGFSSDSHAGFDISTRSGEDGSYRLVGVPPHRLNNQNHQQLVVSVGAPGFAPLFLAARDFFSRALPEFLPGRDVRQDLYLSRGVTLSGRVLDRRTREPVAGATVLALAPQGARLWPATLPTGGNAPWEGSMPPAAEEPRVLSGPDGRFVFRHVPARGFHRSNFEDFGQQVGLAVAWKEGWNTGLATIHAGEEGEAPDITLFLSPAATVEGRVLDGDGHPLAGARVQASTGDPVGAGWTDRSFLWGLRGYPTCSADTDAAGHYRMEGVAVSEGGPATVRVCGFGPRPMEGFRWTPDGEVRVEAAPGAAVKAPDLVLRATDMAFTPFLVLDETGSPIQGASFRAGQRHETGPISEYASIRTGPDGRGRFSFDWGTTEPYQIAVDVSAPGYAWAREYATPEVGGGEEIRIVLRRGLELTGTVHRADGSPAPRAWVTVATGRAAVDDVFPPDENRVARSTDSARYYHGIFRVEEDGRFHARDLPEGPYMVCAQAVREHGGAADSRFLRTIATGVATAAPDLVITLPPDEAPTGAHVECTVNDAATGRPLARFGAALYGEGGRRISGTPIAPGRTAFDGVPPGTWSLSVAASGYCASILRGVEVREGEPPPAPAVALERGAAVHGTIRRADGTPVFFYDLGFTPLAGSSPEAQPVTVPLSSFEGKYRVGGFRPGRFRIELKATSAGRSNLVPAKSSSCRRAQRRSRSIPSWRPSGRSTSTRGIRGCRCLREPERTR